MADRRQQEGYDDWVAHRGGVPFKSSEDVVPTGNTVTGKAHVVINLDPNAPLGKTERLNNQPAPVDQNRTRIIEYRVFQFTTAYRDEQIAKVAEKLKFELQLQFGKTIEVEVVCVTEVPPEG